MGLDHEEHPLPFQWNETQSCKSRSQNPNVGELQSYSITTCSWENALRRGHTFHVRESQRMWQAKSQEASVWRCFLLFKDFPLPSRPMLSSVTSEAAESVTETIAQVVSLVIELGRSVAGGWEDQWSHSWNSKQITLKIIGSLGGDLSK